MKKNAKLAATLSTAKPKKKGKRPSKKEQAQMLAMSQLGMSNYQVANMLNRSPHTVQKYCESPLFTDPKFAALVEEYKEKELIDLTSLNIVARARLHELAPTMNPIESIALMDRSFQQRRLLEGKSTENVSSLRRIISEAHNVSQVDHTQTKEKAEDAQIVPEEHIRQAGKEDSQRR